MRREDWVKRLHDALAAAEARPFDYGSHNCATFAADCVDAIVDGSGQAAALRSSFSDKMTALRYLASQGGFEAGVTALLGEPVKWWRARRGDVCLVPVDDADTHGALGICMGETIALLLPNGGMGYVPLDRVTMAWRID